MVGWPDQHWPALAALATGAVIGAWGMWRLIGWLGRWRLARMRRIGREGEETAAGLLHEAGYSIVAVQSRRTATMLVDGEQVDYAVRADFEVERQGRRWVAEVKAGTTVNDPAHRETRRQLLEYALVYRDAAGVLLVDVPARRIHRIAFPDLTPATQRSAWRGLLIAALLGSLAGTLATWLLLG